jgi:hypothetical protein
MVSQKILLMGNLQHPRQFTSIMVFYSWLFFDFFRQTFHPTFEKVETEIERKVRPNGKKKRQKICGSTHDLWPNLFYIQLFRFFYVLPGAMQDKHVTFVYES